MIFKKLLLTFIFRGVKKLLLTFIYRGVNKLLLTFIFGGFAFTLMAQLPDSLAQYMRIAAENNPGVMQKLNEYKASLEKVPQVGSLPDPELSAGVFLSPMELLSGDQVAEFSLMQMFPWFGVLKNAKDEMSLMAMANYELFKDAKLTLFYEVQSTWYQVYMVKEEISIAEKNIAILRTIERLALTRFKLSPSSGNSSNSLRAPIPNSANSSAGGSSMSMGAGGTSASAGSGLTSGSSGSMSGTPMASSQGSGSLADLYLIQIEIADLENNIALLKNRYNSVVARFNALLNRSPISPVYLPDSIMADTLSISWKAVSDSILSNNPMLIMLEYEQQSLEARRIMNNRMGFPMVGLGLNYSLINESMMSTSEMNGRDMVMPMLKVTLPIYRKKYKALQNEAALMIKASASNYKSTSNSLQTEFYIAQQSYFDAQRRMELYKNQNILAQKSLDIMIKSFSVSGSGLTDILRVRQQTIDYEFKQVEALADYNTSIAYIRRLMANDSVKSFMPK